MVSNIFNQADYQALSRDYETLTRLETDQRDKLYVKNSSLEITKGGFLQAPIRTFKNIFTGGYNRSAVLQHLNTMADKTEAFAKELLNNAQNIKNFPKEAKKFQKK
ncbi:MAG: hypothetical protein HWD61_01330 [Parachlamydiaceae bacterium]|nr:MAG: hypothetical protein HWD61_01330 [Parachlamydiaceae bacterium]